MGGSQRRWGTRSVASTRTTTTTTTTGTGVTAVTTTELSRGRGYRLEGRTTDGRRRVVARAGGG